MKRFLRYGLVLAVLLLFAAAFPIVSMTMGGAAERTAKADLSALTDAAFDRIDIAAKLYEDVRGAADDGILIRARAAARVLAHDDTLLATDALSALCQQLDLYLIDVAAPDGEVLGSSEAGYVGAMLTEDKTLAWTEQVLEDPTKEYAETDPGDESVRMGCVPRGDGEGVVLVRARDAGLAAAKTAAEPAEVLRQMSFIQDNLALGEKGAEEGAFIENGVYVLRTVRSGITLEASRRLGQVYALRNGVMLAMAAVMAVCLLCALSIQRLLKAPVKDAGEEPAPQPTAEAQEAPAPAAPKQKKPRREKKPRQKIFEFVDVEETEEETAPSEEGGAQSAAPAPAEEQSAAPAPAEEQSAAPAPAEEPKEASAAEPLPAEAPIEAEEAPEAQAAPEPEPEVPAPAAEPTDDPESEAGSTAQKKAEKPKKRKSPGKGKAKAGGDDESGFDKVF